MSVFRVKDDAALAALMDKMGRPKPVLGCGHGMAKPKIERRKVAAKGKPSAVLEHAQEGSPEVVNEPVSAPRKRSKYGAVKTHGYDSRKEYERSCQLKLMEAAGLIRNLCEQVVYVLIPAQWELHQTGGREGRGKCLERACTYVADFVYEEPMEGAFWQTVVEDVKSPASKTAAYRIKRKLLLHVHGIRVREV